MADSQVSGLVEQVKVGNTTHNLASTAYGICDTAAGTAEKTVNMTGFYLTKGVTVHIKFTNANSAASPTLNINETGAMPIVQYGTTAVGKSSSTSGWYAGAVVSFTYDGTSWVRDQGFNTNDNTIPSYLYHYNNIKARQAITAESLIVGDSSGYEKVASGVTFDLAYPIVWCTAAVSANSSNYANMFLQHYDRNIATGAKSGFTSSANKVIYLIVTINGNIATIDSNIITDTLPSTEDGKVYISLGKLGAQSTGANYFFLYPTHPMFWYKDGAIRVYSDDIYVKKSGDTMTGNLTLNAVSGDSPSILFTRNGGLTDWKIVDTTGKLSFQSGTDASTWTERGYFKDNSGDFVATSFTGNGSALTNLNASNISSGTLNLARLGNQNKNLVLAGPSSGNDAAPSFRALVAADIPDLSWNKITSDKPTILSGYGITNAVQYNGIDNDIGSSATATNAKAYWANNNKVPKGKVVFNYNSSGTEYTTLFSNNNNSYGSILRWGYSDNYIRILRAHPNQTTHNGWYTEDWEKISAGYADSAGKATNDVDGNAIKTTYAKLASPALTGTPTAPTAANGTNTTQIATTEFVNNTLAYANAMTFKGTLGTGGTITALPASHNAGDTYRVITAGTWAGKYCEVGTLIICVKDGTAAANADWTSVETNEDGAIIGPSSSTANQVPKFSSNTGRVITNSEVKIDDNNNITTTGSYIETAAGRFQQIDLLPGGSWANYTNDAWYRCCKISAKTSGYANFIIQIGGHWSTGAPTIATVSIQTLNKTIALLHCSRVGNIKAIRLVENEGLWLDVQITTQSSGNCAGQWGTCIGNVVISNIATTATITTDTTAPADTLIFRTTVDQPTFTLQDNDGTNSTTSTFTHADQTLKLPSTIKASLTGNADTATKLAASKTLWGQSFNGSANVTGDMIDVGPSMKLPTNQTTFKFLTSTGGAANGQFGRLSLYSTYANADLTNYVLDVGGKVRIKLPSAATNSKEFIITGSNNNYISLHASGIQAYNSSNNASLFYLQYYGGNLQIGSSDTATATRDLYGKFDFKSATGFNFSGISAASDNVARYIWFSYNGQKGTPVYDEDFKYNPSTNNLTVGKVNSITLTAATTGFTIAGGSTTSKTLTVNESVTLKAGSSTYLAYYNGNNVLQSHSLAHFSDEFGSSVKDKKNELVLGNGTGKASNGSSWGQLALYSSGTKGTYLKTEENSTEWYTATLPAKTGIIAYTSDVVASKIEIIRFTA